ncbi:hypothetical protein AB0O07_23480 [Streptomyces sp. NPDC093085]|uniref:hypothetical protein n=1 Tax=Streptomyces sp. NPDC093085 TaxID=3155068 RepID=UPI0034297FE0
MPVHPEGPGAEGPFAEGSVAEGSAADLVPTDRPLTREDPAYVRLLKLVLLGLGGAVPLEADDDAAEGPRPKPPGRKEKRGERQKREGTRHMATDRPTGPDRGGPGAGPGGKRGGGPGEGGPDDNRWGGPDDNPRGGPSGGPWSETPPRRTGIAAFFTQDVEPGLRILLVLPGNDAPDHGFWRLPGTDSPASEAPHTTYLREIRRTTGIPVAPPEEVLAVDYVPLTGTAPEGIQIVFNGGELPVGTEVTLPGPEKNAAPELTAYRWASMDETAGLCLVPERDRIRAAYEAWATGRTAYLVRGERVTARMP